MKAIKTLIRLTGIALYAVIAIFVTIISGCAYLTPTREPPLTNELGYEVIEWKGWTLVGINEAAYNIQVKKLDTWRVMIDVVNKPAIEAREQVINLWSMVATGGLMGGLPLALKKVPKGFVKEDDTIK